MPGATATVTPGCLDMAGVAGLEPAHDGIKTRCLTNLATPQRFKTLLTAY
jgi:hypothetical protein